MPNEPNKDPTNTSSLADDKSRMRTSRNPRATGSNRTDRSRSRSHDSNDGSLVGDELVETYLQQRESVESADSNASGTGGDNRVSRESRSAVKKTAAGFIENDSDDNHASFGTTNVVRRPNASTSSAARIADEKSRMRTTKQGHGHASSGKGDYPDGSWQTAKSRVNPTTMARQTTGGSVSRRQKGDAPRVPTGLVPAVSEPGAYAVNESSVQDLDWHDSGLGKTDELGPGQEVEPVQVEGPSAEFQVVPPTTQGDAAASTSNPWANVSRPPSPPPNIVVAENNGNNVNNNANAELLDAELVDEEAQQKKFREQMLSEAVQAEVYEGDGSKYKRYAFGLVLLFVATLALILGILLRPDKTPKDVPLSDYDFLLETLSEVSPSDLLQDNTTAQSSAFQWLLNKENNYTMGLVQRARNATSSNEVTILQQRYILALLYFATNGTASWESGFNFLNDTSVCDWPPKDDLTEEDLERETTPGVHCDDKGLVKRMFITKNGLMGPLPDEIGKLDSLQYMNLFGNQLVGTIPTSLGKLTNIAKLFIQKNALSGTIPTELQQLSRLTVLSLSNQGLTGTIPPNLFKILTLEWVFLEGNSLNGTIPEVASRIGLESFDLASNDLTGTIPETFYTLTKLVKFSLWSNKLSGTLSNKMSTWKSLEELYVDDNAFTGPIPTAIGSLENLISCWLAYNELTGTIPNEIVNLDKLEWFTVEYNPGLTGTLPDNIGSLLPTLEYLSLRKTSLTGNVGQSVCASEYLIPNFLADCLPSDNVTAEVVCDCCTTCCNDDTCETSVPQICLVEAEAIMVSQSNRNEICECNEGPTVNIDDEPVTTMTCTEQCESCNEDKTVCGQMTTSEWYYNESAEKVKHQVSYQYTRGRNELLTFEFEILDDLYNSYNMFIDGEKCNSMVFIQCPDGTDAYFLDCSNVVGEGAEGASVDTCETASRGGVLEALTFGYAQASSDCPPPISREFFCEISATCQ